MHAAIAPRSAGTGSGARFSPTIASDRWVTDNPDRTSVAPFATGPCQKRREPMCGIKVSE